MKPPPFDYVRARSVEEALDAMTGEDVKIIAGGQSLVPMLNLRLARPQLLVDINDLPADEVTVSGDTVRLGCLVRHRRLEHDRSVRDAVPLFAECAPAIGHPAVRNRGTIGGSLCHADPTAELALAALAAEAEFVLVSRSGTRTVPADEFFQGPFSTALRDDELLIEVVLPRPVPSRRHAFREVAERSGDFATAAAACMLTVDDGRVSQARVAVAGAGSTPLRLSETEAAVAAHGASTIDVSSAAAAGVAELSIRDEDAEGDAAYRTHLLRHLVADVLGGALVTPQATEGGSL